MRRYFESLRPSDLSAITSVLDGLFLVRVDRAQYRWHKQKPYYEIRFAVLKPKHLTGCLITEGRPGGTRSTGRCPKSSRGGRLRDQKPTRKPLDEPHAP